MILLLQGIFLPFLLIISRILWLKQRRKRARLVRELLLSDTARLRELKTRMTPQEARESLKKESGISPAGETKYFKKAKSSEISELILNNLPKLKPLKCGNCGSGVLLKETGTLCSYCGARSRLPDDYKVAVSL